MDCQDGMVRVYAKLITEAEFRARYMDPAPPPQTLFFLALSYAAHPDCRQE